MNRRVAIFIFVALASLSSVATAFDTYRAGAHVISLNDSVSRLEQYMGQPARKEPVQNKLGASIGEYYFYEEGAKTVRFFISGGLVVEIKEFR